jgi:hypothetical protein
MKRRMFRAWIFESSRSANLARLSRKAIALFKSTGSL